MTNFNVYTPSTAPEKSKSILRQWQEKLGFAPNVLGVMAESPALVKGYSDLWAAFESGLYSPVERVVINMVICSMNGSSYCVASQSLWAEKGGIPKDVLTALREEKPLKDARLEALRVFVIAMMKKMGRTDERDLSAFYKVGYTKAHVLEVILGLSLNTIGNYVNHVASPELDKAFVPHRVESGKKSGGKSSHAA
jgi:alkylhydroperoxidase family enzyme